MLNYPAATLTIFCHVKLQVLLNKRSIELLMLNAMLQLLFWKVNVSGSF